MDNLQALYTYIYYKEKNTNKFDNVKNEDDFIENICKDFSDNFIENLFLKQLKIINYKSNYSNFNFIETIRINRFLNKLKEKDYNSYVCLGVMVEIFIANKRFHDINLKTLNKNNIYDKFKYLLKKLNAFEKCSMNNFSNLCKN